MLQLNTCSQKGGSFEITPPCIAEDDSDDEDNDEKKDGEDKDEDKDNDDYYKHNQDDQDDQDDNYDCEDEMRMKIMTRRGGYGGQ